MKFDKQFRHYVLATINGAVAAVLLTFAAFSFGDDPGEGPNYCTEKKINTLPDADCGESSDDCGTVNANGDCPAGGEYIEITAGPKPRFDCNGAGAQPTHNCREKNGKCGIRYGCIKKQTLNGSYVCAKDHTLGDDIPYISAWNASAPGDPDAKKCVVGPGEPE